MSDSWDDYAIEWDANPSVIEYSNKAFNSLCKFVNLQGLSVLDFGCGTGLLAEKVAKGIKAILSKKEIFLRAS